MPTRRILATANTAVLLLLASCAAVAPEPIHAPTFSVVEAAELASATAPVGRLTAAEPVLAPRAQGSGAVTNVTLLVGSRTLDDEFFWQPLDDQDVFGIEFDSYVPGELGYEVGFHLASASESLQGVPFETDTIEVNVGARKTWGEDALHPYLGGGLSFLATTLDIGNGVIDDSDGTLGFYLHGGAYYRVGDAVTVGFDYRKLFGTDVQFTGFVPSDLDYDQLLLTLGFTF